MLTRDFLLNADCKTAFGAIEESLLWSAEQRAASLAATLACRPDDGPVWIFGYGSLMWNPALEFEESCTGTLVGWHRAFCLRLTAGRGTACQPGRMLALKEGGRTTGVAYRLPDASLEQELTLLWKREMITGCYLPTWCQLTLDDGRTVNALVFDAVRRFGGSISAEHGIGQLKRDILPHYQSPVALGMMRTIKQALDPKNTMNPGKMLSL